MQFVENVRKESNERIKKGITLAKPKAIYQKSQATLQSATYKYDIAPSANKMLARNSTLRKNVNTGINNTYATSKEIKRP